MWLRECSRLKYYENRGNRRGCLWPILAQLITATNTHIFFAFLLNILPQTLFAMIDQHLILSGRKTVACCSQLSLISKPVQVNRL